MNDVFGSIGTLPETHVGAKEKAECEIKKRKRNAKKRIFLFHSQIQA